MNQCPICENQDLQVTKLHCCECGVDFEGTLETPPLKRLGTQDSLLAEQLILHGGNLKSLADEIGITYPTLRKRLDVLIGSLAALRAEDEKKIEQILGEMENRKLPSQEGIRRIRELKNGA